MRPAIHVDHNLIVLVTGRAGHGYERVFLNHMDLTDVDSLRLQLRSEDVDRS